MGQKEKLIERLKSKPKTFTFDDAESLLRYFAYERSNKGRTSGSRIMFVSEEHPPIMMHRPHPRKELLEYQVKQLIQILEQEVKASRWIRYLEIQKIVGKISALILV